MILCIHNYMTVHVHTCIFSFLYCRSKIIYIFFSAQVQSLGVSTHMVQDFQMSASSFVASGGDGGSTQPPWAARIGIQPDSQLFARFPHVSLPNLHNWLQVSQFLFFHISWLYCYIRLCYASFVLDWFSYCCCVARDRCRVSISVECRAFCPSAISRANISTTHVLDRP